MSVGKSFGDSPALNFIKTPEEQENAPKNSDGEKSEKLRTVVIPEGMALNPALFVEKKTKRVQLVLRQSTFDAAKAKADSLGISLNEYVHALIDNDTAGTASPWDKIMDSEE